MIRAAVLAALLAGAIGPAKAASPPAVAGTAMVVTGQHLASDAGAVILRAGGNAVDAAVAIGYAEAVVNPCCGNIGGGGFMTLRLADGRTRFLDFRETAPAAATARMYLGADGKPVPGASVLGWRAVGVPGTVAGLEAARARWGTMRRQDLLAPAIALAREGFVLTEADAATLAEREKVLARDPASAAAFLRNGTAPRAGDRLIQSDLAATLQAIAEGGPDAFYEGRIPQAVAAASQRGGGLLTARDFADYRPIESEPLRCSYRGYVLIVPPPPSSGGVTLCEILGVVGHYDLASMGWHGSASVHVLAEAMRHAYFDRNTYLGDPAFVDNPIDWLLSSAHLDAIRSAIGPAATPTNTLRPGNPPHEEAETTSYGVVDRAGNAVAVTYTLNGSFGAGVMAPGTGFELNDEMDDFTIAPNTPNLYGLVQGTRNAVAPGKRPLSSMTPSVVLQEGKVAMLLGSPGGARIITTVLQTFTNVVDFGMAAQDAVDAPRIHMQGLPDAIFAERFALSPDTQTALHAMGYRIGEQANWSSAELILRGADGLWRGAHDARRPAGSAVAAGQ